VALVTSSPLTLKDYLDAQLVQAEKTSREACSKENGSVARLHAKIEPTSSYEKGQVPQMSAFEYHYGGQVTFHSNTDI